MKKLFKSSIPFLLCITLSPGTHVLGAELPETSESIVNILHSNYSSGAIMPLATYQNTKTVSVGSTGVKVTGYVNIDMITGKIRTWGLSNITGTPTQLSYDAYLINNEYSCQFKVTCYNTAGTIYGEASFVIHSSGSM